MITDLWRDVELRKALASARGAHQSDDSTMSTLARVAWSVLAEPGDGVAGALIAELGPVEALRFVLQSDLLSELPPFGGRQGVIDGAEPAGRGKAIRRPITEGIERWRARADPAAVRAAIMHARDVDARLVLPGDEAWPTAIDDLDDHRPIVLWVRGDADMLRSQPSVAIVGARAASGYGEMLASEFAGDLAAGGAVVVSGGAYGIDGAAHRAALGVGGSTIAFLAGGVDRAYPQGHQQLLRRISETGAVVSEVPCGTAPTKWRFLSRNRLIAAAADATVVVEAGWRSGSLNTAGHAASLGRPLGAVPGPVTSAASAGCHRLMREYDARCVTTSAEIRELWSFDATASEGRAAIADAALDPDQGRLLDAMSTRVAATVLELTRRSGLGPSQVSALLGMLELEGTVRRTESGWRRVSSVDGGGDGPGDGRG